MLLIIPGHYKFNEDDSTQIELTNGQDAAVIAPGYLVNKPWFVYDSETGLYKRFQNGEAQTDGNNGEQVAVKKCDHSDLRLESYEQ